MKTGQQWGWLAVRSLVVTELRSDEKNVDYSSNGDEQYQRWRKYNRRSSWCFLGAGETKWPQALEPEWLDNEATDGNKEAQELCFEHVADFA